MGRSVEEMEETLSLEAYHKWLAYLLKKERRMEKYEWYMAQQACLTYQIGTQGKGKRGFKSFFIDSNSKTTDDPDSELSTRRRRNINLGKQAESILAKSGTVFKTEE
jgi:hypothetical protein